MDNPSYGMPERHGGVSPGLSNGPSHRRVPYGRPSSGEVQEPATQTIIVTKDYKNSYGMKISGDKPVYVQSVNEGGAAERAGLNSGDTILMVNGINVTQSMHTEVVELIRSSPRSVELTVRPGGRPPTQAMASPRPLHHHHSAPARNERITPPQPVDVDKQRQVNSQREHTLRLMLEKEQRYAESLRSQLARGHDSKLQVDLRCAENHIRALANQLASVAHEYAPLSPVTSLVSPLMDTPPPLPSRNRPLTLVTPPPPPRHYASLLHYTESGEAQGIENLQNALSPATNHYLGAHHSASSLHTHHRTKSSPDPLNLSPAEASRQFIASESMLDLSFPSQRSKSTSSACDMESPRGTPPGTPPPPYGVSSNNVEALEPGLSVDDDGPASTEMPNNIPDCSSLQNNLPHYASTSVLQQHPIISMEDDDMSDQEVGQLENHGPFKSLNMLWNHHAHLAVFMNYLRSNSDCSSLLFFLITDQYREGNAKEMKKWAYEIHSSFLVPGAPLRLNNVDENVAREIDEVLLNESDKEEILRKVFWKARLKAKEELNEQLADFQQKRTAGLSSLFGAQETQLQDCIEDKTKASEIAKDILLSIIDSYKEDLERANVDSRRFTTAAAICTVMNKTFGIRGPHSSSLVERCPTFVSKDKSLKNRLIGKSRKLVVRGHHFVVNQYYIVTYCNHCQLLIGGIGPQGFQCADCSLNIHRHCVRIVEESCPGPLLKKEKTNDRISKLMEKIRPERETRRKPSSANTSHLRRSGDDESFSIETDAVTGERPQGQSRRPDPVRESEERTGDRHLPPEDDDLHHDVPHHAPRKSSATSINRSESYKERVQKKQLRERRKTSDPNLSKTNDADLENQGLSYNTNSGSSSNSSLSTSLLERVDGSPVCRSLDSPSNSLETVTGSRTHEALTVTPLCGPLDSDLEAEPDPPDWTQAVDDEVLRSLSAREKKRQEVINELFHTERSHVRNLKVLNQVFYRPMVENQILPHDQIQLLFSNLEEMLDIHSQFSNGLKKRRQASPLVKEVADLLLMMFDGPSGENFQQAAATFCARQQIALESLKERRRKDNKLNSFLTDAEGNPMCRRLQLKDIIPTAMQRLTKYPLLFESLARYTTESPEEATGVHRAVERSKEILNHVNHAVREAEDNQRLIEIQKKLDKSGFEKGLNLTVPNAGEFGNLDLTKHRLIYEGPLNWRISNKQKAIDLHVLLLDDMIILLQKQDDKYYLKFYNTTTGGGDSSLKLSPIIKVSTVLVRHNAVDNNALYLVNTAHNGAQIYDLVAATPNERKMWFRHISEAAEAYKARDGKNRRPDAASATPTPETDPAEDKTKENDGAFTETTKEVDLLAPPTTNSPQDNDTSPQTSSPGLPSAEPTPQVSPASEPADHLSRKLGEGLLFPSPGSQRRRQDPVRLTTEESPLIQPSEVVVSQRPVLTAEPVVMPIEKLRRKDEEIRQALDEKRQLVADILHVPREEYENIADIAAQPSGYKEGTELILAAISQVNHMVCLVNDALRVTEEEAVRRVGRVPSIPAHQIQEHISVLNIQLTQMLKQVKEHDEEKERMRRELQRLREQVHGMHDNQRRAQQKPSPATSSRPNSCISVGSGCDQSEDDTGLQRLDLENDADTQDTPLDAIDDATTDVFVDALSGEADLHLEAEAEDREI